LAVHFAAGGVVKARGDSGFANGVEEARSSRGDDAAGVFRNIETDADMALGAEVLNLVWSDAVEQLGKAAGVGQIGEVHEEFRVVFVPVGEQVIDTLGIETARAALDAMDFIAFTEEQLGQVRAVLAGDAGDESSFRSFG
jgi:hypothetical protein